MLTAQCTEIHTKIGEQKSVEQTGGIFNIAPKLEMMIWLLSDDVISE